MKKILTLPALLLMGLISCNSGTGSESSSSDSTQATASTVSADTSHAAMSTTTIDPLPSVPTDAKVFFKNLKMGKL